jgi:hypothetical protein
MFRALQGMRVRDAAAVAGPRLQGVSWDGFGVFFERSNA